MNDAIVKALDVASRELCFGPDGEDCDKCMVPATCKQPSLRVRDAAAAIAAFLRALPDDRVLIPSTRKSMASAIERAAGGAA